MRRQKSMRAGTINWLLILFGLIYHINNYMLSVSQQRNMVLGLHPHSKQVLPDPQNQWKENIVKNWVLKYIYGNYKWGYCI